MTDKAISPLRQRLIDDIAIRRLGPKTQHDYIRRVKSFADFVGHSPDKAAAEDVHRYQLRLASIGATVSTVNATASALQFFFRVTLKRRDLADAVVSVREPPRLPVVLSPQEVGRLLASTTNIKHRAALSLTYATGLRANVDEFIRRFLIHVLPDGFHRIRHYGLLANANRADNIALARRLLGVPDPAPPSAQSDPTDGGHEDEEPNICPCCGGRMIIIETFEPGCQPRLWPIPAVALDSS